MGLDLAFNRKAAVAAGLVLTTEVRDPLGAQEACDEEMRAWCSEVVTIIRVPGAGHYTEDTGDEDDIVVRANKWGPSYAPLTAFLNKNGIPWEEF